MKKRKSHSFEKIIGEMMTWTGGFGLTFSLLGIIMFYLFEEQSGRYLMYAGMTFIGLFLLSIYLGFVFHTIKKMDRDYFKNVMVGISGGLAVWVFSGIEWDMSKGFWVSANNLISKIVVSLGIIFIGFVIYQKTSKKS